MFEKSGSRDGRSGKLIIVGDAVVRFFLRMVGVIQSRGHPEGVIQSRGHPEQGSSRAGCAARGGVGWGRSPAFQKKIEMNFNQYPEYTDQHQTQTK